IHSSNDPKPKRKRANDWQLQVLNKVFDQVAFPTANVRKELAQLLGMTPRSVQIWFQNRRYVV
ncbi:Homeodomain-like protein, partial [Paraphysoderma sedebokerense]